MNQDSQTIGDTLGFLHTQYQDKLITHKEYRDSAKLVLDPFNLIEPDPTIMERAVEHIFKDQPQWPELNRLINRYENGYFNGAISEAEYYVELWRML